MKMRMHMWCPISLPLNQRGYPYSPFISRIDPCSYSRRLLHSLSNLEEILDFLSSWKVICTSSLACPYKSINYLFFIATWLPLFFRISLYRACFLPRYHRAIFFPKSCDRFQVITLAQHFHLVIINEGIILSLSRLQADHNFLMKVISFDP